MEAQMRNFNNKDMAKLSDNCRFLYLFHLPLSYFIFSVVIQTCLDLRSHRLDM